MRRLAFLLGSVVALVAWRPASASLVLEMDLPALVGEADRVVVGEVLSVRSAWDQGRKRILSTIEVQVSEAWKGRVPGSGRVTIVQPGGTVDDIEMKVHGMPSFTVGTRAVLFLRGEAAAQVVGMAQGLRPLRYDTAAKRWMAQPGDRSAVVKLDGDGRAQPVGPAQAVSLDELRARVKSLLPRGR